MSDSLRLYSPWNSLGQNTGVGTFSLSQGIFSTQGSNPGLPHWRWILYQLSHKESPRIMEWVTYAFSSKHPQPRNWTEVSCIASGFLTNWAIREAHIKLRQSQNNKYGILPLRYCNCSQNLLVLIPDHVCTIFMYFKQIHYITQKLLLLSIVIFNFIMLLFSLLNVHNFYTGSLLLGKYWTPFVVA